MSPLMGLNSGAELLRRWLNRKTGLPFCTPEEMPCAKRGKFLREYTGACTLQGTPAQRLLQSSAPEVGAGSASVEEPALVILNCNTAQNEQPVDYLVTCTPSNSDRTIMTDLMSTCVGAAEHKHSVYPFTFRVLLASLAFFLTTDLWNRKKVIVGMVLLALYGFLVKGQLLVGYWMFVNSHQEPCSMYLPV